MIRIELTHFSPLEPSILQIRFEVFVAEQGVDPSLEVDGRDPECVHAIAYDEDKPIGTGRLLPDGHIGRMAVLKEHRSKGVGQKILLKLVEAAREKGWKQVELSSQIQAVAFYERFGFQRLGDVYVEAGIDHVDMRLDLE
jgi:predicted GNAT family N-acyltransferase